MHFHPSIAGILTQMPVAVTAIEAPSLCTRTKMLYKQYAQIRIQYPPNASRDAKMQQGESNAQSMFSQRVQLQAREYLEVAGSVYGSVRV